MIRKKVPQMPPSQKNIAPNLHRGKMKGLPKVETLEKTGGIEGARTLDLLRDRQTL